MSYGHGIAVSLQLARAYTLFSAEGEARVAIEA
jgi:hypothetical protein